MNALLVQLALACLGSTPPAWSGSMSLPLIPQDDVQYMGKAYVFQADVERARRAGWIGAEDDEGEVLDRLRATLERRVRNMGMFPEARVVGEENRQLAVIFVGRMDPAIESFLVRGLSNPGRISYRVLAGEGDLPPGESLVAERGLLESWRAAHPDEPLEDFNRLPRDQGGPDAAIVWLQQRPGKARASPDEVPLEPSGPLPLLRNSQHEFRPEDVAKMAYGAMPESEQAQSEPALVLKLTDEHVETWHAFGDGQRGRRLAFVINDRVVEIRDVPESFENSVVVGVDFSAEEYRELLLAFSGGPLEAPLVFVEFSKRPLHGVKTRPNTEPSGKGQ